MSDRVDLAKVGVGTTRLTLAVELVDAFTGSRPGNEPRVSAANVDAAPVTNPSGFHLFLDLPDDPITVVVDGDDRYLDLEETVDPTEHDPPAVRLEVTPSTAYRFPPGATLLRGVVVDGSGDPIEGATVSLLDTDRETETDENGEFVQFFTDITPGDIERTDDGVRLIRIDGSDPNVRVTHPGFESTTVSQPVEEGATSRYDIVLSEIVIS